MGRLGAGWKAASAKLCRDFARFRHFSKGGGAVGRIEASGGCSPTPRAALFSILIAANGTVFLMPFTHTALKRVGIDQIRSIVSRYVILDGGPW